MAFDANAFLDNEPTQPAAPAPQQAAGAFDANSFLGNEPGVGGSDVDKSLASYAQAQGKYGTVPQQILAGVEGAGEGAAGPLSTLAEKGLSNLGVPGLSDEDIRGRAEANPLSHTAGQVGGFGGSLLAGVGLARVAGLAGKGALAAVRLGKVAETAPIVTKLAATGVATGAEMAALQTSDEISKAITNDPNQTMGTAAINIGLSSLLGGAGGIAVGSISPLWKTAANKIGAEKIGADFLGETKFLNENPDLVHGAANEVGGRMAEADQILNGGLKGKAIAQTLPAATAENLAKIDEHLFDISNNGFKKIQAAKENTYLKNVAPKMEQDLQDFNSVITDPKASIHDKWDALDQYKRASQGHADYNILTGGAEEKAVSKWIKPFNAELREAAENSKIWGEAGNIQKTVNSAAKDLYEAQKDFLPKVTSKELGERVADPTKLQTLINQAEKGKGELRKNAINNYLEATQKAADAINKAHIENGLEAPLSSKLNSTPVLDHVLNTPISPGRALARWAKDKGASSLAGAAGKSTSGLVGGGIGAMVGHPLLGAWMGEKVLTPVFSALSKPFAENAINSEAMKSSIDYVGNVIRGDKILDGAAKNIFKAGAEVVPNAMLPKQESRDKLKKSLSSVSKNPQNVGGNLAHYLPAHATAAATIAASAQNYLNALEPKQQKNAPLDAAPPVDKFQESKYNRALDIAQQPLMVLQHAKDGTLTAQDVLTLNTIYPQLHGKISDKISEHLMNATSDGKQIPYHQRQSLGLLLGSPLDSTFTPQSMQAIMHSAMPQQMAQQGAPKQKKASGSELRQIDKVNALYKTPLDSRAADKKA